MRLFPGDVRRPPSLFASSPPVSKWQSFGEAFSIARLKEVVDAVKRPRQGYKRGIVLGTLALILIHDLRTKSSGLLYTNKKFGWTEKEYTTYQSIDTIHNFARAVIVLPILSHFFEMHDAMIGMIGALGWITYYVVVGKDYQEAPEVIKLNCTVPLQASPQRAG